MVFYIETVCESLNSLSNTTTKTEMFLTANNGSQINIWLNKFNFQPTSCSKTYRNIQL